MHSFAGEEDSEFANNLANFVTCPECQAKLKDMDAVMMHSCSDRKEVNSDDDNAKKILHSFPGEDQEIDNHRSKKRKS